MLHRFLSISWHVSFHSSFFFISIASAIMPAVGSRFHAASISFHVLFRFVSIHFISFQFISFHFISFHFISFHFISFCRRSASCVSAARPQQALSLLSVLEPASEHPVHDGQ